MFDNIKAVIFDMDGTLIDSMWLWKAIDIEYLGRYNIELPDDLQKAIEGKSFSETAEYFKERFGLKDDLETIKRDWNAMAMDYYINKVALKDDVAKFIEELKARGIRLGIGTSNSVELVEVIMDKFGFHDRFDAIRTSCEVDKGKPHPDIFLKVADDLGIQPSQCMVFEDIPNGLIAARNAGMCPVAINDDFSRHMEEEKRNLSDYFIDSYDDAIRFLMKGTNR